MFVMWFVLCGDELIECGERVFFSVLAGRNLRSMLLALRKASIRASMIARTL